MIFGDEVHIKLRNPRKKNTTFRTENQRTCRGSDLSITRVPGPKAYPAFSFNTKCNHSLQIEHHATLEKTFKLVIKTMKTLGNCLLG